MRCHKTTITTPTPELGSSLFNHPSIIVNDEVMMVGDGGSVAADAATHPESFNHIGCLVNDDDEVICRCHTQNHHNNDQSRQQWAGT